MDKEALKRRRIQSFMVVGILGVLMMLIGLIVLGLIVFALGAIGTVISFKSN